jgi:hypothetical protein
MRYDNVGGSGSVDKIVVQKLASEKAVKRVGSVAFLLNYKFSN